MLSVEKQIECAIKNKQKGVLLVPDDFKKYGTNVAVRKALERLENRAYIVRVAYGIYVRPKISKLIGTILPPAEEVAETIAKRDRIRMIPSGVYAMNILGLSTQVPMNLVFLTDGSPREIQIGKRKIKFKKTTPKNLMLKGRISSLAIQALKEIGQDALTQEQEYKILEMLRQEDLKALEHDIDLAPVWIQKVMKKSLEYEKECI